MQLIILRVKSRLKENPEILLYALLGLITFALSINFSKDWSNYKYLFSLLESTSWSTVLSELRLSSEPLYKISSKGLGSLIGFPAFVMLSIVSLLTVKLIYLKKITSYTYVSLFFYISLYLLLHEGTAIRIGLAVGLIVPALYFIKINKYHYSLILILAASQLHFTALVFLLAFPSYFFKPFNNLVYLTFLISPLIVISEISVLNLLKDFVVTSYPKYAGYFDQDYLRNQNSTGLYFYFIAFFALLMIVIRFYLRELVIKDRFIAMLFSLCLMGIIAMCVFNNYVAVGARFGELLMVPIVILLTYLYAHFAFNKMLFHQLTLVSVFVLYFVARLLYLYPSVFSL